MLYKVIRLALCHRFAKQSYSVRKYKVSKRFLDKIKEFGKRPSCPSVIRME